MQTTTRNANLTDLLTPPEEVTAAYRALVIDRAISLTEV